MLNAIYYKLAKKDLLQINILFTWQGVEISQTQTC